MTDVSAIPRDDRNLALTSCIPPLPSVLSLRFLSFLPFDHRQVKSQSKWARLSFDHLSVSDRDARFGNLL